MADDKYWSISLISQDVDLQQRVIAAAAKEGIPDPSYWAMTHVWDYAAQPGWGEKYQYALDTANPNPGRDDSVITDLDILTAVQAIRDEERPDLPRSASGGRLMAELTPGPHGDTGSPP